MLSINAYTSLQLRSIKITRATPKRQVCTYLQVDFYIFNQNYPPLSNKGVVLEVLFTLAE